VTVTYEAAAFPPEAEEADPDRVALNGNEGSHLDESAGILTLTTDFGYEGAVCRRG